MKVYTRRAASFLRSDHIFTCTLNYNTNLYTWLLGVPSVPCRPSVAGCPGAWRRVPVNLHVTMEGPGCTGGQVRGGATSPRTKNSRGPGARQRRSRLGGYKTLLEQLRQDQTSGKQQWQSAGLPLALYACRVRARQIFNYPWCAARFRRTAGAIETGRPATASAKRTSVAFAARWKQNAARRSDLIPFTTCS